MVHHLAVAAAGFLSAAVVSAQTGTGTKCGEGNLCPTNLPCCSQYGECGVGAYCLGGCDPLFSNTLDSCVAEPVCQTKDYQLNSLDGITPNTKYLGDASKSDWVSSGTPLEAPTNDAVILTLSEDGASNSGTLLATTHYVWYGKVSATMKSSRGQGVVSAFILLSDNKDEIDFEFIGADLNNAQSNYYWQGVTNYDNEKSIPVSNGGDTFSAYHNYTIDWQPDQLTWSIDGSTVRTLKKSDTFNKTDNQYHYPQTPARVQLSLWPAGISKNGQGTVQWSGGLINWKAQDVQTNGYYYSMFKDVKVQCYNAPSNANVSGSGSYIYTNSQGMQSSIAVTNNPTVLKSLLGTGTDLGKDLPSAASSSGAPAATNGVATIPGLTGAGPGTDGTRGGGDTGNSGGGSGSNGAAGTSGGAAPSSTGIGGFSQGNGGSSSSSKSEAAKSEHVMMGSMFAALMAFAGMLLMM